MIPSGGGVFEVVADGDLVFSKKKLDRFPEHSEVFEELDAHK
jgi:selT/selW/selH-like putative selenoprotein